MNNPSERDATLQDLNQHLFSLILKIKEEQKVSGHLPHASDVEVRLQNELIELHHEIQARKNGAWHGGDDAQQIH